MDRHEYDQVVIDRLMQATFGLWNSLLTVNGVMLAVFSVFHGEISRGADTLVNILIGACVVSCALLVFNYLAVKVKYVRIGAVAIGWREPQSDKQRGRDIRSAEWASLLISASEWTCLLLILGEVILIAVLAWHPSGNGRCHQPPRPRRWGALRIANPVAGGSTPVTWAQRLRVA